jgi:uncharacterized membrane protein HdeD (DUF308 family)
MTTITSLKTPRPDGEWKWTFAYGAALVLSGIAALCWPIAGALAIGLFLGWTLSVAGILGLVAGFRARHVRGHWRDAAVGGLSLVLGLLILLNPLIGTLTLLYLMSFWFAMAGVVEIASGVRHKSERVRLLSLGALDLLLSILLLSGFAGGDVGLVATLAGVSFIASGLVTIIAALELRMLVRAGLI